MKKNYKITSKKICKRFLDINLLETEFAVGSFRLDTLAYDEESKSFRIIEYKNVKIIVW